MNLYEKSFNKIFPRNLPKIVPRNSAYCRSCECSKKLDTFYNIYVCEKCGDVSTAKSDYLSPPMNINIRYIHSYKRSIRFGKILDKSLCIQGQLRYTLMCKFKKLSPVFKKVCYGKRKNFIRYKYIIIKLLELLGRTDLVHNFSLPKSKDITIRYDKIWIAICRELRWKFIPSV